MGKKGQARSKGNQIKLKLVHKPHHEGEENPFTFAIIENKATNENKTKQILDKFKPHEWKIFSKKLPQKDLVPILDLNNGVSMLQYDENGIPLDGYDYYKYLATNDQEGEFFQNPNPSNEIKPDIDFNFCDEIGQDQKQVWDALYDPAFVQKKEIDPDENENEIEIEEEIEGEIEGDIEDDFVNIANEGEQPVLGEQKNKVTFATEKEQIQKNPSNKPQDKVYNSELDQYFQQVWEKQYEGSEYDEEEEISDQEDIGSENQEQQIPEQIEFDGKIFIKSEVGKNEQEKGDQFIEYLELSEYQKQKFQENEEEEDSEIKSDKSEKSNEEDKWDAESILTTYSNQNNRPQLIKFSKKMLKQKSQQHQNDNQQVQGQQEQEQLEDNIKQNENITPSTKYQTKENINSEAQEQTQENKKEYKEEEKENKQEIQEEQQNQSEESQSKKDRKKKLKEERKQARVNKKQTKLQFKAQQNKYKSQISENLQGVSIIKL